MTKPHFVGRNFTLFISDADGEFVPIREVKPMATPGTKIVCLPTPCKGGFEYVPDWWGITHFG
jgi:hypothetical protein